MQRLGGEEPVLEPLCHEILNGGYLYRLMNATSNLALLQNNFVCGAPKRLSLNSGATLSPKW